LLSDIMRVMNKEEAKPKAVVTGGAGFIGSHLVAELCRLNWKTVVIDDLSSGKIENISPFLSSGSVEFIQGSVTDLKLLSRIFSGARYVFHEAAIASVPASVENPVASHETNLNGTLNVLLAARDNQVRKVIFASSCALYGNEPTLPKKEEMEPDPQSPYSVNKLAAEYYCGIFTKVYGLPTACLRYFNVYGPRQDPNSQYSAAIPKFIQIVRAGTRPIIYGDGEQTRDFIYVKDVVRANIMAAENQATGVFNIGSGQSISINKLVSLVCELLNRPDLLPVFKEERAGDVRHSLADISKARQFGFSPEYSIEQGLKDTI